MSGNGGVAVSQKRTNSASASLEMVDVPLETFDLPRQPIEPAAKRCLHPLGIVRRKKRRKRGLDDKSLRHALAVGVVGELAGEIRWQAERVLGSHGLLSKIDAIARIHRRLSRETAGLPSQDSSAHAPHRRTLRRKGEFRRRLGWFRHDLFVLRKFRLAADAAIRGIARLSALARRADFRQR